MKKFVIIFTFALTALLLNGCGRKNVPDTASPSAATENTQPSSPTTNHPTQNVQDIGDNATKISEEEAKQIALKHAGLTADQITFIESSVDWDNGREKYDVEFYTHDQKEYDYEIDPYTGEVLDVDYDAEYYNQSSGIHEGNQ